MFWMPDLTTLDHILILMQDKQKMLLFRNINFSANNIWIKQVENCLALLCSLRLDVSQHMHSDPDGSIWKYDLINDPGW